MPSLLRRLKRLKRQVKAATTATRKRTIPLLRMPRRSPPSRRLRTSLRRLKRRQGSADCMT